MQRCELVLEMLIRFVICWLQLFVQSGLAQRASRDVLRDLAYLSLHVMLDTRIETADDADQVVRGLNVLVLKMVEKTEHTAMIR